MATRGDPIAFSAYRTSSQQLTSGTKVLFNKVWTNVGNGYKQATGIFTAPRAGLYHFTAVILSKSGKDFFLRLYHNMMATSGSWAVGDGYKTGTFDVVLSLEKGDVVYLAGSGYHVYSDGGQYLTFSGHSIQ